MMEKITRNYLEIKSIKELSGISKPGEDYKIEKVSRNDFQLNKFLYKQIGKKYNWVDRLAWTDRQWRHYVSNEEVFTYVLKKKDDLADSFLQGLSYIRYNLKNEPLRPKIPSRKQLRYNLYSKANLMYFKGHLNDLF